MALTKQQKCHSVTPKEGYRAKFYALCSLICSIHRTKKGRHNGPMPTHLQSGARPARDCLRPDQASPHSQSHRQRQRSISDPQ